MAEALKALKERDELPMQTRLATIEVIKRAKAAADDENAGDDETADDEDRSYEVSLSSETPVDRWYGREILEHSKDAVDLARAAKGLNLLFNHDADRPIGRLENLRVDGGKLKADMRFYSTDDGRNIRTMVDEGMREVSIGYGIDTYEKTPGKGDAPTEYRATRWTPLEGSIVSVPADYSVGVGRSADGIKYPVHVRSKSPAQGPEENNMAQATTAAPTGADQPAVQIMRLAQQHKIDSARAIQWVEEGKSLDEVRQLILDERATKPVAQPAPKEEEQFGSLALNEAERQRYSYARAIVLAADSAEGRRVSGFEMDISQELERLMPQSYKRLGGVFIPTSMSGAAREFADKKIQFSDELRGKIASFLKGDKRAMDSQTVGASKELVFNQFGGELIEILRNMALVVQMGARVLTGLSSPVSFPRQISDAIAYWVGENSGVDVTSSSVGTDLVTLNPRTLQAATAYSRQLLVQSSIDVEAMVRGSIAASHALAWDLAALHGTGSNGQPTGIYNYPGVGTTPFGGVITYANLLKMEAAVANANAIMGALGWLTNPSVASNAKGTLQFSVNGSRTIWEGTILEGEMDGYPARATNQVSKTLGAGAEQGLVFGNWSDLLIGQFGGAMEMIVDPYTLKKQGLIEVASFQMCDVAIRHAKSFDIATGLTVS